MVQHLILTDVSAPLILLGAPVLLALGALPTRAARRLVSFLRSRVMHAIAFPACTWLLFIGALWTIHLSGLYEAALDDESLHVLEHIVFLGTALLFWLPVIVVGPVPWTSGPLAYPLRMLYVFAAMPAESLLGFVIYNSGHVLYPHYAASGLADQQAAGEIMWIGAGLVMFVAFMACGVEWMRDGVRRDEREVERERSFGAREPTNDGGRRPLRPGGSGCGTLRQVPQLRRSVVEDDVHRGDDDEVEHGRDDHAADDGGAERMPARGPGAR
jgi:cytochrome c oxidase assembly factor CtaG